MRAPKPLLGLLLLSLGLAAGCYAPPADPVYIRDAQGRALILHGLNVSGDAKFTPDRMPWVEQADVERMAADWGFNFARFLITWDFVEPEPGVYGEAYLDDVAERLDWFQSAGIHVVLDMHQDLYGPVDSDGRHIGGNGHPAWSFWTDEIPFQWNPISWFLNYWSGAITRAFDHFWDYEANPYLQDHYVAAWVHVVERFKDHPAVLGYDFMNEPWAGSRWGPVGGLTNDGFDSGPYRAFLERSIAAVRATDPNGWIFFEPRAYGPNDGWASNLGVLDDPRPGEDRLAYFPHYYSLLVDAFLTYDPAVDASLERWVTERKREIDAQHAPLLIGEWGTGPGTVNVEGYLKAVARMADRMTSGWAYWDYSPGGWSPVDADRNETLIADLLVRAYPRRIAGQPVLVDYDPDARQLVVAFDEKEAVTGPTEIYVPRTRFFPDGFTVQVMSSGWDGRWDPVRELLTVCVEPYGGRHVIVVSPEGVPPLDPELVLGIPPEGVLESCPSDGL